MQRTALISVYDKAGIENFARELAALGWKIISSGGTKMHLEKSGIAVTDVAEITGMPPILSHRVVTLHPKIHGGLLSLDTPEHQKELEQYGIPKFDLVCVDLYPLEEETKNPNATRESVIEKTDVGGPTMLRSAAKGRRIVICEPEDRKKVLEWLKTGEPEKEEFVNQLAAKAETIIARYCAISAEYHTAGNAKGIFGTKAAECAYGENAWQKPAGLFEFLDNEDNLALSNWQLVAGSPMSYNNFCDLDRMMQTVTHIGAGFEKNFPPRADQPRTGGIPFAAIGVKHGNACGAGIGDTAEEAVEKMLQGDLRAIFGGGVCLNFPVDEKVAEILMHSYVPEGRRLLDVVAAPSFTPGAVDILSRKKGKCRLLANPSIERAGLSSLDTAQRLRYVRGGFLTQPNYAFVPAIENRDIVLAWAVGCTSNSNTITLVKEGRLYGNGVGQQDRVGAAKLAIFRADEAAKFADPSRTADLQGAVAYSDSFFPFPDAPEVLIARGIKTIFSTSGSVNDDSIRALCREKGVELILLPDAEARGFFQH